MSVPLFLRATRNRGMFAVAFPSRGQEESALDPFTFVIVLVLILTGAAVLITRLRHLRLQGDGHQDEELDRLREDVGLLSGTVDGLGGRVERLEEERDFYKNLLDAPREYRGISSPQEDPSP